MTAAAGYSETGMMPLPGDTVRFQTARMLWTVTDVGRWRDGVTKVAIKQVGENRVRTSVPAHRLKLVSRK